MLDPRWYLIHSKARQEDLAELNLGRLGVETFCPRFRKLNRKITHSKEEVVFPGYLFIKVDMSKEYPESDLCAWSVKCGQVWSDTSSSGRGNHWTSIRDRAHNGLVVLAPNNLLEIWSDRQN